MYWREIDDSGNVHPLTYVNRALSRRGANILFSTRPIHPRNRAAALLSPGQGDYGCVELVYHRAPRSNILYTGDGFEFNIGLRKRDLCRRHAVTSDPPLMITETFSSATFEIPAGRNVQANEFGFFFEVVNALLQDCGIKFHFGQLKPNSTNTAYYCDTILLTGDAYDATQQYFYGRPRGWYDADGVYLPPRAPLSAWRDVNYWVRERLVGPEETPESFAWWLRRCDEPHELLTDEEID